MSVGHLLLILVNVLGLVDLGIVEGREGFGWIWLWE